MVILSEKDTLSLSISYILDGNKGLVIMQGRLDDEKKRYNVSRKSYFSIKRNRNIIQAQSYLSIQDITDNSPTEKLQKLLPPFYLSKDITMEFYMYHQGWNGYIFSTGYVPVFYCKRH